jgi:hypothetical protein
LKLVPPSTGARSDEALGALMVRTPILNSMLFAKKGVPLMETFHRVGSMLPHDIAEHALSEMRHIVVAHIAGKEIPEDIIPEGYGDSFEKNPAPLSLEKEIEWMDKNVDPDSFTSLATMADLCQAAGFPIEARIRYADALKVAREQGTAVNE